MTTNSLKQRPNSQESSDRDVASACTLTRRVRPRASLKPHRCQQEPHKFDRKAFTPQSLVGGNNGLAHHLLSPTLLCLGLFVMGCIVPSPIDEEDPPPDVAPWVGPMSAEPTLGEEVVIDLRNGIYQFAVRNFRDFNEDQVLYWRAVINYSGIAISEDAIEIFPEERDAPISYTYLPCTGFKSGYASLEENATHTIFIAISDAPFANPGTQFSSNSDRVTTLLQTDPPDRAVSISWTVQLINSCP